MDFDDLNIVGIILGLIGGGISLIMTSRMGGGLLIKILGFVITAIVCYFVGGKIADD